MDSSTSQGSLVKRKKCQYCKDSITLRYLKTHEELCGKEKSHKDNTTDMPTQPKSVCNAQVENCTRDCENILGEDNTIAENPSIPSSNEGLCNNEGNDVNDFTMGADSDGESTSGDCSESSSSSSEDSVDNEAGALGYEDTSDMSGDEEERSSQPTTNDLCNDIAADCSSSCRSYWVMLALAMWQVTFNITGCAFHLLLKILWVAMYCSKTGVPTLEIPMTLYRFWKLVGFKTDSNITRYVVCTACHTLYKYEDCTLRCEGKLISKLCSNIPNPDHTQLGRRQRCNTLLLEEVISAITGRRTLKPFKEYCYKSIKGSLASFVARKKFEDSCESWRFRQRDDDILNDIYDGNIWKKFQQNNFFNSNGEYGLILNVDWFQPFKHVKYSIGVIYLVVLNLPRQIRFRPENVILVGVIPHFKPLPAIDTYIKPLVDELIEAWSPGFFLTSFTSPGKQKVIF